MLIPDGSQMEFHELRDNVPQAEEFNSACHVSVDGDVAVSVGHWEFYRTTIRKMRWDASTDDPAPRWTARPQLRGTSASPLLYFDEVACCAVVEHDGWTYVFSGMRGEKAPVTLRVGASHLPVSEMFRVETPRYDAYTTIFYDRISVGKHWPDEPWMGPYFLVAGVDPTGSFSLVASRDDLRVASSRKT